MNGLEEGQAAPEFCLQDTKEQTICLNQFKGKWVVLYFYPKDNTSGCTLEAIDFSNAYERFGKQNVAILGVSPDSVKSHCNFAEKHDLKVQLLSDPEHVTLTQYEVWALKKMYGREYYGVERSTFMVDPDGVIQKIWRKVKVKGHVDDVFEAIKQL